MEEDIENNVIKGPWKKLQVKQPEDIEAELEMKMEFAEELTQELIVHMVQMCNDNKITISDGKLINDLGMIIEFTKGMVYRGMEIPYPTQNIVDRFVDVDKDNDGATHTDVNMEHLSRFIELFMLEDDNDSS